MSKVKHPPKSIAKDLSGEILVGSGLSAMMSELGEGHANALRRFVANSHEAVLPPGAVLDIDEYCARVEALPLEEAHRSAKYSLEYISKTYGTVSRCHDMVSAYANKDYAEYLGWRYEVRRSMIRTGERAIHYEVYDRKDDRVLAREVLSNEAFAKAGLDGGEALVIPVTFMKATLTGPGARKRVAVVDNGGVNYDAMDAFSRGLRLWHSSLQADGLRESFKEWESKGVEETLRSLPESFDVSVFSPPGGAFFCFYNNVGGDNRLLSQAREAAIAERGNRLEEIRKRFIDIVGNNDEVENNNEILIMMDDNLTEFDVEIKEEDGIISIDRYDSREAAHSKVRELLEGDDSLWFDEDGDEMEYTNKLEAMRTRDGVYTLDRSSATQDAAVLPARMSP